MNRSQNQNASHALSLLLLATLAACLLIALLQPAIPLTS